MMEVLLMQHASQQLISERFNQGEASKREYTYVLELRFRQGTKSNILHTVPSNVYQQTENPNLDSESRGMVCLR